MQAIYLDVNTPSPKPVTVTKLIDNIASPKMLISEEQHRT